MKHTTVLVVEDEPGILRIARHVLDRAGYEVVTADDGPAAVAAFRAAADRVAAVVLDLNLPGLSGWDVLAELRRERPDLPIVVTTGDMLAAPGTAGSRHVPTAVLPKPYRPADLAAVVARVLAAH